ncbi:MAG: ATP-binding protein, partial [Opitutaceae bacterium]
MSEPTPAPVPQESADFDFKASFAVKNTGDWCELLKDIVAMANSGGGRLLIGVTDDGKPSGVAVAASCTSASAETARSRNPASIPSKAWKMATASSTTSRPTTVD